MSSLSGTVLLTGATRRDRASDRPGGRAAPAELILSGRRGEVLDPLAEELGARVISGELAQRNRSSGSSSKPAGWTLIGNAGDASRGRARRARPGADRPGARGQPEGSDRAGPGAGAGDGGAPAAATSCSCPRCRARPPPRRPRSTPRPSSASGASRSRCARISAGTASGSRSSCRGSSATPACSPTPVPSCRPGSGRVRPRTVARAVFRRSNETGPRSRWRRCDCGWARRWQSVAPGLSAAVSRRLGSERIAARIVAAQRKRQALDSPDSSPVGCSTRRSTGTIEAWKTPTFSRELGQQLRVDSIRSSDAAGLGPPDVLDVGRRPDGRTPGQPPALRLRARPRIPATTT